MNKQCEYLFYRVKFMLLNYLSNNKVLFWIEKKDFDAIETSSPLENNRLPESLKVRKFSRLSSFFRVPFFWFLLDFSIKNFRDLNIFLGIGRAYVKIAKYLSTVEYIICNTCSWLFSLELRNFFSLFQTSCNSSH